MSQLQLLKLHQLAPEMEPDWLWDGYLAAGQITLFTALRNSGKTTLVSHLLAQRNQGGVLLGQKIESGREIVVSEETPALWLERNSRLGFNLCDCFLCRPFAHSPNMDDWKGLVDRLRKYCDGGAYADLVILDPVSHVLPAGCENNPAQLPDAMKTLRRLADDGIAVLLVHHPRKAAAKAGAAERGTGALHSFVDILLEMYPTRSADPLDRRRRLLGFSRHAATPRSLLFELQADASGYTVLEETFDDEFQNTWQVLQAVMASHPMEVTRSQILSHWPNGKSVPKPLTLWRWLDMAHDRGLVHRAGVGSRFDPYRYSLPFSDANPRRKPIASEV